MIESGFVPISVIGGRSRPEIISPMRSMIQILYESAAKSFNL